MKTYKVKINNQPIRLDNNKIEVELTEEQLDDLIKQRENKGEKFFFPKNGDNYYVVHDARKHVIKNEYVNDNDIDINLATRGVFRTKEQAQKEDEKRLALVRLWKWVQENGLYFEPDWSDNKETKHCLYYDYKFKEWTGIAASSYRYNFLLPFFKTPEDCQKFIDNNLSDLNLFV